MKAKHRSFSLLNLKIKEAIVDDMVQVRVDNLQTLTQVSSVLGRATENPQELAIGSQVKRDSVLIIT